jgi:chromosome segregation ATPase
VTFREWLGKLTGYAEENAYLRSENISCRFLLSGHEKKIRELESELTNLKRANEKLELEAKALKDADRILVDVKDMFQKLQDSISPNILEASFGDGPLMNELREGINEACRRIRSQKAVDSEKNVRAPYLYSRPEKANLDATQLPPYLNPAWNSTRIEK